MSNFFSFFTKVHQYARLARSMQEREDYEACMVQERQEELHDALKENQSMEKRQMKIVSQEQEQQKTKEKEMEGTVRFPRDEEFQLKMKNAEMYVRILLDREKQKKEEKEKLMQSVREAIEWQRQKWRNPVRSQQEAAARAYFRMRSFLDR